VHSLIVKSKITDSMIALIDYGSGNLRSVRKALEHEGGEVQLADSPEQLADADAMVLPGVGAFGDCVRNLQERRLWQPVKDWLASGRPFLGICLGYQMLFDSSEESPGVAGFGFFRGTVKRFADTSLKVPHMGWNSLTLTAPEHVLWRELPDRPCAYFVHSYYPAPADRSIITSTADYGGAFAASVGQGNVAAVQFHPEKSQTTGLAMLRNFIRTFQPVASAA
jgi:imidazole glycerol-phosphate synthase subunit HisH